MLTQSMLIQTQQSNLCQDICPTLINVFFFFLKINNQIRHIVLHTWQLFKERPVDVPRILINHKRFSKTRFSLLFIILSKYGWGGGGGGGRKISFHHVNKNCMSSFPVCSTVLYLAYKVQLIFMNELLLFGGCRLLVIVSL